jgi:hypothetical protein
MGERILQASPFAVVLEQLVGFLLVSTRPAPIHFRAHPLESQHGVLHGLLVTGPVNWRRPQSFELLVQPHSHTLWDRRIAGIRVLEVFARLGEDHIPLRLGFRHPVLQDDALT